MRFPGSPLGAAAGLAVDGVLGDPPDACHPVAWFGQMMEGVEARWYADSRSRGVAYAATGLAVGVAAGFALRSTAAATAVAVGRRGLERAASAVRDPLRAGDLEGARASLPALVGRDPSGLDEQDVCRAVVESVAENTVDAVVAPLWWASVIGAPGVLAHRAVNTMDAMVGHRSLRYARYGWASARLDDAANWIPARLTVALVASVRPRRAGAVGRAVRLQAPGHPSPNAGVAEAAFAAALDLRLGGTNRYDGRVDRRPELGWGRPPQIDDIDRALRLLRDVSGALAAGCAALGASRSLRHRCRQRSRA